MDRQQFAQLIASLDHLDPVLRHEAEDRLVEAGVDGIDTLSASLGLYSEPRVLTSLISVLRRLGSERALLPLMRFTFDNRTRIALGDARGLAMQAIASLATPAQAERLFDFLVDMLADDDPFVRGYATSALAKFGDRRAVPFLKERAADDHDFVRERAAIALRSLETATSDALKQDVSDDELVDLILANKGAEQSFYMQELREREAAFEIAAALVHKGSRGRLRGLQVMLELGDTRARSIVSRLLALEITEAERAVSFRILALAMNRDATQGELDAIEISLRGSDPFIRAAALQAAGSSGSVPIMRKVCESLGAKSPEVRLAAAKGLDRGTSPNERELFPALEIAVGKAQQRRLREDSEVNTRIEAHIVRAISHVLADGTLGAARGQKVALLSLLDARDKRPLIITGLELLEVTTPEDGLREDDRWQSSLILGLVDLIDLGESELRDRAMDLLIRGARPGGTEWIGPISDQIYQPDPVQMEKRIIPLLELSGSRKAVRLLTELTEKGDDMISIAAAAALRRIRDDQEFIDAEFES